MILRVKPVIDYNLQHACVLPYPGHPKGCPNYGKKDTCPPQALRWEEVFDTTQPCYCIINQFDLGTHIAKLQQTHPDWSRRQLVCCLYWQGKARVELKKKIEEFTKQYPAYTVTKCPEAMGIDVTETLKNVGIVLQWPPKQVAYQVAFASIKKE